MTHLFVSPLHYERANLCANLTCICDAPVDMVGHHGLFVVKVQEDVLAMEKSMYFMYLMLDSDF
jgi:hypothetical protein